MRTQVPRISRGVLEAATCLHLPEVLKACRTLQPEVWAHWAATGAPAVFRRLGQTHTQGGRPVGTVAVGVALDGRRGWARIAWSLGEVSGEQTVELAAHLCPVLGLRWAWTCPETGRPYRALYLPDGAARFAGRIAHRLVYRSQRASRARAVLVSRGRV